MNYEKQEKIDEQLSVKMAQNRMQGGQNNVCKCYQISALIE